MDFLDDIIASQIKSLPSDDGIYENYNNNYNRLIKDIKSFNRNDDLIQKASLFPKLSKRIRDLKKIKVSEKKLLDFTNKMDQAISTIQNKGNKEYFDDQILLKILRASDVYGRSLDNAKGFLGYINIIMKKDLPVLNSLVKKYVKVEKGLIDLIKVVSDDETQLPLIKKRVIKLELESLYKNLSHTNVDFIGHEQDRISNTIYTDLKSSKQAIYDYQIDINGCIDHIGDLLDNYNNQLSNDNKKQLEDLRHKFLLIRNDVTDSRYIHGKLLAKKNILYNLSQELISLNKRSIPLESTKKEAVDLIKTIGLKRRKSKEYASQIGAIQQLRSILTTKNIKDSYNVINHYLRYHIVKPMNTNQDNQYYQ